MIQPAEQMPAVEDADIHTASDEYAARFGGKTGLWMLDLQEKIVLDLLEQSVDAKILDLGGGHGQLSIPLIKRNFDVTVFASSADALLQVEREFGPCASFQTGSLLELPFDDAAFDIVLCFRLVTHSVNWQQLLDEICRVSRKLVIIDYPTDQSINALTPMLFSAKKKVEKNTRPYMLFKNEQIKNEFARRGFAVRKTVKQFFWPMVIHRMLKSPALSSGLELLPRLLGLTRLWGSPVIVSCSRQ